MPPRSPRSAVVLGVDPGVSETGWAVLDSREGEARLTASGLIRTTPRAELPRRLLTIHEELLEVLSLHRPAVMAVEEMFFLKAAKTVRATLQARGVVLLTASRAGAEVREYNPRQVKLSLTGSGSAPKAQMQRMVQSALGLKERLRPDDVADAAAIALCHVRLAKMKTFRVIDRIGGRA